MKNVDTIKGGGFEWVVDAKVGQWLATKEMPTRIRQLDDKTFACYRAGKYLGSEATLPKAFDRVKAGKLSEANANPKPIDTISEVKEKWPKKAKVVPPNPPVTREPGVVRTVAGGSNVVIGPLLERGEGCTREDILAATGWPSVSVQAVAKKAGLALRVDKARKPYRYYGSKS